MSYFLYNGSLQYQCVFDNIESIFSSHTVCASHQDVCNRLILFRWFQIRYFDFSQHLLAFSSPNEVFISALLSLLVPFLQQLLIVLSFIHASILSFIIFIHSVIILEFLCTAL